MIDSPFQVKQLAVDIGGRKQVSLTVDEPYLDDVFQVFESAGLRVMTVRHRSTFAGQAIYVVTAIRPLEH